MDRPIYLQALVDLTKIFFFRVKNTGLGGRGQIFCRCSMASRGRSLADDLLIARLRGSEVRCALFNEA